MGAREQLTNWIGDNVADAERSTLSRLIAAYVAECVRADREKQLVDAERAKKAHEAYLAAQKRVDAINGKAPDLSSIFGDLNQFRR